ncbi:unnamed protein product [Rotaria sordida]|uniref:Uncharacterized protein n=1 Tax=Rotaria sordida TaxID=392033 RepID=A0A814URT4_9BILA|nr:unnamed protein product [Rotaria sordida]
MVSASDAGGILIGKYLGANEPLKAINVQNVTFTVGGILLIINTIFVLVNCRWLPLIFGTEITAHSLARNGLLVSSLYNIFDGFNAIQNSILRACGQQKYAAIVSFIGFYIIGLPMAYIFMFIIHMDIYGYWIGMIVASSVISGILFVFIWRLNWNAMAQITIDRIHFDKTLETSLEYNLRLWNRGKNVQ